MLSPDMILEDIRFGEKLEAKKEYYKAYWVYMFAESAVEREDEAMCLIGSPSDFGEAVDDANTHRRRAWKLLTEEEKDQAKQGKNPFVIPPDIPIPPRSYIPYDLGGYYFDLVQEDIDYEEGFRGRPMTKKESRRLSLLFILICLLRPFYKTKRH